MPVAPLRASTNFYIRFTLPKISSSGFGSAISDYLALSHHVPRKLRTLGFPSELPRYGFSLPLTETPWYVIQNA
jgi:hypothetical protein